jgi:hypothetical protein
MRPKLEPGFKSDAQRDNFEAATKLHRLGGPLAKTCGARLPGGKGLCGSPPVRSEKRCLSHGGPHAARRFRVRQLRELATGKLSPAEWARAEDRRARNVLKDRWKKDPRVLGATIDLGPDEWAFRDAAKQRDVDVDALYPAIADWLRWQWQRNQRDRGNLEAWMRICRSDLPKRTEKAHRAAQWAALGGYSRSTRHGRQLASSLAQDGPEAAEALVEGWRTRALHQPSPSASYTPLTPLPVRPWCPPPFGGVKRRKADEPKEKPRSIIAPAKNHAQADPAADAALLRSCDLNIRAMFLGIASHVEQREFLAALRGIHESGHSPETHLLWSQVLRRCKQNAKERA